MAFSDTDCTYSLLLLGLETHIHLQTPDRVNINVYVRGNFHLQDTWSVPNLPKQEDDLAFLSNYQINKYNNKKKKKNPENMFLTIFLRIPLATDGSSSIGV